MFQYLSNIYRNKLVKYYTLLKIGMGRPCWLVVFLVVQKPDSANSTARASTMSGGNLYLA